MTPWLLIRIGAGASQAGVRGMLAFWAGGAVTAGDASQAGVRGMLAFWAGGAVTAGGTAEVVPPTDTHDGWYDYEDIRRRYRRIEEGKDRTERERQASQERLSQAIEDAYNKALGIEPAAASVIEEAAASLILDSPARGEMPRLDFGMLASDLAAVRTMLERLAEQRAIAAARRESALALEEARLADEADAEMLLLMSVH